MRELIYHVAATVDGFIADARHGVDAFANEGDHVAEYRAALASYDTVVMGRRTYEFGQRYGVTDPYPWAETVVFGHFAAPPDPRVRFTTEDPAAVVRALKARAGSPVYLCGGGTLARALFDAQLVDELIVKLNPALLGAGVPLAPGLAATARLRLRATTVHGDAGVVVLRYRVEHPR